MAYGLPIKGQADYDDELNNSIEFVRSAAEAAQSTADNAATSATTASATANTALTKANEAMTFATSPTDEKINSVLTDDTSDARGTLDAAYAGRADIANGDIMPIVVGAATDAPSTIFIGTVDGVAYGHSAATVTLLQASTDDGQTWRTVYDFPDTGPLFAVAALGDGEMLALTSGAAYRSTGWDPIALTAPSWTSVATPTPANDGFAAASFIGATWDKWGQYVILGEYVNPKHNSRKVRLSTDNGATFTDVFDLNTQYPADVDTVHIHGVGLDPWANLGHPRLWFTHGDGPSGMFYSDDLGATWTQFNGGTDGAFNPTNSNVMTVKATPRGMVLTTDSNAPDGVYRILHTDNPADMVIELMYAIPYPRANGALLGFGTFAWRDDDGLIWLGFVGYTPLNSTPLLGGFLFATDGLRAAMVYETPHKAPADGQTGVAVEAVGITDSGLLLVSYRHSNPSQYVAIEATPGGRGGRPYGELNAGNALTGTSTKRDSVAIGPNAVATEPDAVVIGSNTVAADQGVAVGASANASGGTRATAIGRGATATSDGVALGEAANAGNLSLAIGRNSVATAQNTVAIGNAAVAQWQRSVALGQGTTVTGADQVQVGGRHFELGEIAAAPTAPAVDKARIYVRDDGAGEPRLYIRTASGERLIS
jgi:hypothetical protein